MQKAHYKKGFTLIEMIVSLGIFTIVALIAVTALLKIMDANRKAIALKTSINNLNFTLESMSREMRVGKNYSCNENLSTGANNNLNDLSNCTKNVLTGGSDTEWTISFNSSHRGTNQSGTNQICNLIYSYQYTNGSPSTLKKAQQEYCDVSIVSQDYIDVISPEIKLDNSIIEVNNDNQPHAKFFFHGVSGLKAKDQSEISIQTSVTQRLPK